MADSRERRRHPRFAYFGRCWCEDGSARRLLSFTNVSHAGASVASLSPLALGATATLRWNPSSSSDEIVVTARVVWQKLPQGDQAGGMGLEFTHVVTPDPLTSFLAQRQSQV